MAGTSSSHHFAVHRAVAACLVCAFLSTAEVRGQGAPVRSEPLAVAHVDTIRTEQQQPYVLPPFVHARSVEVYADGVPLDTSLYRFDHQNGELWVDRGVSDSSRVLVARYRTQPFEFKPVYRRRAVTPVGERSDSAIVPGFVSADEPETASPFGSTKLQRKGSITRGILAGNRRDVSVESGLRMELSGELVEGVQVQAVLTDESTPIQPEGTTQRLSEFDRVAIQLQARYGKAELGDFDLLLQDSEFARFNRKLQGASVRSVLPALDGTPFVGGSTTVAAATARGQYRIQEIQPLDGVQGPYRLEGNAGERFIIVLAGSEVMYMDGQRLERGETNDYVIDYQTGEVTFTPRRIVTDDRRIAIEFQYTTYEYTRTLVALSSETKWLPRSDGAPRVRFGVNLLREADSRQFSTELGFTAADSLLLAQAGDGLAVRSGAEPIAGPFDPEAPYVQYVRETQSAGGRIDTVFVALREAPEPGQQVYRLRFTRVGQGRGSYTRADSLVNGILYEYRGEGLGEYDPVRILPKPEEQRLVDLNASVEPVRALEVFGEWAGSLHDENRISPLDAQDDRGRAYHYGTHLKPTIIPRLGTISAHYVRRVVDDQFEAFDRIRPVEFGRQWNLVSRTGQSGAVDLSGGEALHEAAFAFAFSPGTRVEGEWGQISMGGGFEGVRQSALLHVQEPGLPMFSYRAEYIQSRDSLFGEDGTWLRQLGTVQYQFLNDRLVPRLQFEQEERKQAIIGTDSLARTSLGFTSVRPGLSWITERLETGGDVEIRREQGWAEGELRDAGTELTVQTHLKYNPSRTFNTDANVGVRLRQFNDYFRIQQGRENNQSIIVQWNSRAVPFKRAVEANWYYEALTERTPLLQEIYLHTRPEMGQYVWEDANNDGIIQVDEFLPERTPNEGTYIKTFIPSDSLVSVIGVQAKLRLNLDPARIWKDAESSWKRALAKVATRSTIEILEKSREQQLTQIYLLNLNRFLNPSTTMNGRIRFAQEIQFFRNESRYGVDLSYNHVEGLSELSSGEESRLLRSFGFEGRYRPTDQWGMKLKGQVERNRTFSTQYSSRRYDIRSAGIHPEIAFHPTRSVQLTGGAAFSRKRDTMGERTVQLVRLPVEFRYAQVQRLQVTSRLELAHVSLSSDAVGMALYELTEGRGLGRSLLWNIDAQYAINSYLRASFTYDGRAPSGAPALHMFRLQMSASF